MARNAWKITGLAVVVMASFLLIGGCGNGSSGPYVVTTDDGGGVSTADHTQDAALFSQALCSRCHTDGGARTYITLVNGTEDPALIYSLLGDKPNISVAADVQCMTCHDLFLPGTLLGDRAVGLPSSWSSQFKTCTACHQLLRPSATIDQALNAAFHDSWGGGWNPDRVITDTHFDDPGTPDIEGYIINSSSSYSSAPGNSNEGTCLDCHNQHRPDLEINRQWAHSAHGGHIASVKQSDPTAAVTPDDAPAWADRSFNTGSGSCKRCHTATGFRNFANSPATYSASSNVYTAAGSQKEMLYCWACHYTNDGWLRDPGPLSATAPYAEPADRIAAVPDLAASNGCMACHSGRETGETIRGAADASFSDKSFVNSHYMAAGGVIFRTSGYEYKEFGLSYEDPVSRPEFEHKYIGLDAVKAPGTGSGGPCVGCHMRAKESHLFGVVRKDADDHIVEITANESTCSNCHAGDYALTPQKLEFEVEEFEDALDALRVQLGLTGSYFSPHHPYFYTAPYDPDYEETGSCSSNLARRNWLSRGLTVFTWDPVEEECVSAPDPAAPGLAGTGKHNMGAAFNYNLLKHEPGAYAHNRYYTKRLIYDSIDWLDDAAINNSVGTSLDGPPHAGSLYQEGARAYLLGRDGGRP